MAKNFASSATEKNLGCIAKFPEGEWQKEFEGGKIIFRGE